eukprot:TRINITY_DN282_c0_g1_i1.p1 TRINITY_DN282_c0_g1~~TRINITY_DN282_c0_g1_i1.p1  ORF type:complete len:242 (-),score=34.84 TRINITY_DN282_c0_g1_i1:78-803(-)
MASLYVGKLSRDIKERDLDESFGRYGKIERISIKQGYAFVDFEDSRDAEDAVRGLDGTSLDGERIIVEVSHGGRGRGSSRGSRSRGGSKSFGGPPQRSDHRLYVENLPRDISWQDLKDHFRSVGDVLFGDAWTDRNGKYKGVIEFKYRDDLKKALKKMDESELRGKIIRVFQDARKKNSRSRSRSYSKDRSRSRSRNRGSNSRSTARRSPSRDRSSRSNSREKIRSPDEKRRTSNGDDRRS